MGDVDWPKFKAFALINALGGDFEYMQSQVHEMADDPGFSANTIVRRIQRESDLIKRRAEQGEGQSALPFQSPQTRRRERLICTHCKRPGHSAEFCISPGGRFAGHTLGEARGPTSRTG